MPNPHPRPRVHGSRPRLQRVVRGLPVNVSGGACLSYQAAMRVLLEGVSGVHPSHLERETGLPRHAIVSFMNGAAVTELVRDTLAAFIWRRMNGSVLLSASDRESDDARVAV